MLQVQELESALSASQGEVAREAERRRASQLEAQRSEAAAHARRAATTEAVEVVAAARAAALDDAGGAPVVAPHDWTTALVHLSVQPTREEEQKCTVDVAPLKPANDELAEAPFASSLEDDVAEDEETAPTHGTLDAAASTRKASDAPAAAERSALVDDEDGADLSSLLLDQLPPEMRYWGAVPAPPLAKAPVGETPSRPALAHATNAQALPRPGVSCQADGEPAAAGRPPPRPAAAAPAFGSAFGYGAELLDLLDQLENTPP